MSWYINEQPPVYLDYNATTPLDGRVEAFIIDGLKLWANPSSDNDNAARSTTAIDTARTSLAMLLHVSSNEVFFISGGTEANNWVIHSAIETFKVKNPDQRPHIISSAIDHPSILQPLQHLKNLGTIDLTLIAVDPTTGQVMLPELESSIKPNTCLVTIMQANNETGVMQPITEVSDIVRRVSTDLGTNIFMHTDAAQAIGKMDVNLNTLKVDAVTVVGHKFYGPRIGALVIRNQNTVNLVPMMYGGGQEHGMRSGTENTPMILGLGEAARIARESLEGITEHLSDIRDYFESQLEISLPNIHTVHFKHSPRLPNTSSVAFPTFDGTGCDLLKSCKTFLASTGAACHTGAVSEILISCGISRELASRTVRFSFGRETTKDDIDRVIKELKAMFFFSKYGTSLLNAINKGPVAGF